MFIERDGCTEEELIDFDKLEYKNKITRFRLIYKFDFVHFINTGELILKR